MSTWLKGNEGEAYAAKWLTARGHSVLHRNFRCRWGEVDLITQDESGDLFFVEVKSWRGDSFDIWESIPPMRRRRLSRSVRYYLAQHQHAYEDIHLSALLIQWRKGVPSVEFLENAFEGVD